MAVVVVDLEPSPEQRGKSRRYQHQMAHLVIPSSKPISKTVVFVGEYLEDSAGRQALVGHYMVTNASAKVRVVVEQIQQTAVRHHLSTIVRVRYIRSRLKA